MSHEVCQHPTKRRRFFAEDGFATANFAKDAGGEAFMLEQGKTRTGDVSNGIRQGSGVIGPLDFMNKENGDPLDSKDQHQPIASTTISAETGQGQDSEIRRDGNDTREAAVQSEDSTPFDTGLFTSIIGEDIPRDAVNKIRVTASNDVERAVNVFFDGSWKDEPMHNNASPASNGATAPTQQNVPSSTVQPQARYVGAFGVGAWVTRSGTGLLNHGEHVNIERTQSSQPMLKPRRGASRKDDVITRFTNQKKEEIGRLPRDIAAWVSTLIDQKICKFEGTCVFAPERLRVNDTVYLQLRCYILKSAFQPGVYTDSMEDSRRETGLFQGTENAEEKSLRLRQIALVSLFDEICLRPTSMNETMSKQKKEGLLRATEMSEQSEKTRKDKDGGNAPSSEDESEELQENQLDTLYKKAQSFDFNMPESEPASTFALELRRYQKQALHWMLAKERDTKTEREMSIHPLWEEYTWPQKDVDDNLLPKVEGLDHFYVNPYSGELSLRFPVQDHRCLGGILADEMGTLYMSDCYWCYS